MEISPEQAIDIIKAVNLDEMTIEIVEVKVRYYKDEPLFDDEEQPLLDENGKQLKGRKPSIRTAHIQNMVSVDAYHEAMSFLNQAISEAQQVDIMRDLVLKIWQISEPFMNKKMLTEGIDFNTLAALFARFFDKENRLSNTKV